MYKLRIALLLLAPSALWAQQYTISTIAGGGPPEKPVARTLPMLPLGLATDSANNVYIGDSLNSRVWKLSRDGFLTAVAGNGQPGFSGDGGPATSAQLNGDPVGVAVDGSGNVYIAEGCYGWRGICAPRVRHVSADGIITTVAGNGRQGYSGDGGPAINAALYDVSALAVDGEGNLYIADSGNFRVRRVASNGVITTVAGNGIGGYSGDGGPAISAQLGFVEGVAVDGAGNLYLLETSNSRVRKVSPNGIITTVAGNGSQGYAGDGGPATSASLNYPVELTADAAGNVYVADGFIGWGDCWESRVRKVAMNGIITTVAGNGTPGYSGDGGPATSAALNCIEGLTTDRSGNLYLADTFNNVVRMVSSSGIITTVAGIGRGFSGEGGPAISARLGETLLDVTLDAAGNIYFPDRDNGRVLKVTPNGVINTIAGGQSESFGPPMDPEDVAVDKTGNVYFAAPARSWIRKISPTSNVTTVAGNGNFGYSGDGGPATSAQLGHPGGVAVDATGNLYIADRENHRIRKVSVDGIITTVVGNGAPGDSGDGGPATNAQIGAPFAPAVDGAGNLYFADYDYHRIRKVSANGTITSVAGNGTSGYSGDGGPAVSAQLSNPAGLALDNAGNLYIADYGNVRVRKVSVNGIISTIAGNGASSSSGDGGPALSASFGAVYGVAVDVAGNVYVADSNSAGGRIRLLEPDGPPPVLTAVTNAASNRLGSIAPGEVVVLYHSGIGPAQLTEFRLNDAGFVSTQLDRAQVTFNGTTAPLVYTWTTNLAAVVPYSVRGTSAQVQLTFRGQTSAPLAVAVAASSPGVFTADSSGTGQAAALNENGALNSSQNPAKAGSVITLYATGEGQTSPAGVDGKLGTSPAPTPVLPVVVTIGGQTADVLSKGGAPGVVAGVMEIKARIPSGTAPGNSVPVAVQVGSASSQSGVTIAVASN